MSEKCCELLSLSLGASFRQWAHKAKRTAIKKIRMALVLNYLRFKLSSPVEGGEVVSTTGLLRSFTPFFSLLLGEFTSLFVIMRRLHVSWIIVHFLSSIFHGE